MSYERLGRRVTSVIGEIMGEPLSHGTPEDRVFWMERGSAVHLATELFDQENLDWSTVDPIILGRVQGWQKFRREIGGKIIALESEVVSAKQNYRGRLDRILRGCAMFPVDDVLLDIKSGKPSPFCALQTMAYKMAWGEMGPKRTRKQRIRRMSVELTASGNYKTEVYDKDDMDTVGWMGCLWAYEWKERNGLI